VTLYLDTSSLVKLYVAEPESESIRRLVADADIVATAAIAYPEARAALARRRREGNLHPKAFTAAKRALDDVDPKERDISTLTMSISKERYDIIKERIRTFRNELSSLITSDPSPESVYQMSIALFPLSKKDGAK